MKNYEKAVNDIIKDINSSSMKLERIHSNQSSTPVASLMRKGPTKLRSPEMRQRISQSQTQGVPRSREMVAARKPQVSEVSPPVVQRRANSHRSRTRTSLLMFVCIFIFCGPWQNALMNFLIGYRLSQQPVIICLCAALCAVVAHELLSFILHRFGF